MSKTNKTIAFGVTALMVLSAVLVIAPAGTASTGGRQNNFVDPVSISPSVYYPGDHPVTPTIAIRNIRTGFPSLLINTTVSISGIQGSINPIYAGTMVSPDRINFTYYSTAYFTGFRFDIQNTVACGMYTMAIVVDYQYYLSGDPNLYHDTEQETFQIEIRSILNIDTQVKHYYDDNSYPPSTKSTLYAGETFQRMGISAGASGAYYARDVEGDKIVGTLSEKGGDYSGFTWEQKTATIQNCTLWSYFIYRLSVDPSKKAGRYDYNIELSYTRQDSYTGGATTQIKETSVVSLFVDFTPLLDISSGGKATFTQGSTLLYGLNVTFKNVGNCPLNKLYVGVDIGDYFTFHGGYYYNENNFDIHFAGNEAYIESLSVGAETTVTFLTDVDRYIPAGEHRISVLYHGYYYDDGSFKYTDYKTTNQNTYYSIKQKDLYIQVDVVDTIADIDASMSDSISLAGRVKDMTIPMLLTNKEMVGFDDVTLTLSCFPKGTGNTTSNAIFINPKDTTARSLPPVTMTELQPDTEQYIYFKGDLAGTVQPGFYDLDLTFSGTNQNSRTIVTKSVPVSVRVVPTPAKFFISGAYNAKTIKTGKWFDLTLQLQNIGKDTAREVFVTFDDPAGDKPQSYIINGDRVDAYKIDGLLNPFTVNSSRVYIGEIAPESTYSQNYQVHVDKNIARDKTYEMSVTVAYRDSFGGTWTQTTEITIIASGSSPEKPVDNSPWMNPLGVGTALILLTWFMVMIGYVLYRRMNRPKGPMYSSMQALPPQEQPLPMASATPAALPPPPPQYQQQQPPPPQSQPPVAHTPQPHKVCRKCQMTVDPREMSCPRCGNPMK